MKSRQSPDPLRVLYIGGWGRSGSTLIAQMLGARDGVVSIGEARFLWERGVLNNELCSCGSGFLECPFWREVGGLVGGWSVASALEMVDFERRYQRIHTIPRLLRRRHIKTGNPGFERYADRVSDLYHAIGEVSGASLVVDSSKDAPYLALLGTVATIDVRSLHLVRDSRAAAYSWMRVKRRPEITGRHENMPRLSVRRSAREYCIAHVAHELVSTRIPTVRLRYEDVVLSDGRELDLACSRLGWNELRRQSGRASDLEHSISGNPRRFDQSVVKLRLDDEWTRSMPSRDFAIATALTLPLLIKYGYSMGRPRYNSGASST